MTRFQRLVFVGSLLLTQLPARAAEDQRFWVFVGTYTGAESKGIYRFELDPATGQVSNRQLAAETPSPSFLAIHPSRRFLYAVGETADFGGKPSGSVCAFALDPKTGTLTFLNRQSSGGTGPCHLVVDREGTHVLVANYGGGNASVIAIQPDGRLGEPTAFVQHKGTSVNPQRQEAPHAHSINLDAANRFAVVADLGLDKLFVYRYHAKSGTLTPNDLPFTALAPGSGPRHFAFHPNGRNAYAINEIASTVIALRYDDERGVLKALQTITTLPEGSKGNTATAEVQVHPSGKFVYGSNRGHDSIAIFTVEPETGELKAVGHQGAGIKTPRNFAIDPTGTFLLVANQGSNSIVVFRIDPKTGALTPVGDETDAPSPVCLKLIAIER